MSQNGITGNEAEIRTSLKKLRILSLCLWLFFSIVFVCVSLFIVTDFREIAFGFSFGFLVALLNLQLLGYSFLPIIVTGKNGIWAVIGIIFSFCLLLLFSFLAAWFSKKSLIGFAGGLAGVILVGFALIGVKFKKGVKKTENKSQLTFYGI